jgi:hypothetical protein
MDTMETTAGGRGRRFGSGAARLAAAAALALLVLGATLGAADAQPASHADQNSFVDLCRAGGGTPKRVRTRVVRCTNADGSTMTCDFNVDPPTCTTTPAPLTASGGSTLPQAQPVSTGTHVVLSGGRLILVADDDER